MSYSIPPPGDDRSAGIGLNPMQQQGMTGQIPPQGGGGYSNAVSPPNVNRQNLPISNQASNINMNQADLQNSMRQEFDVFKAAKAGLLIACQDIVERMGTDELTQTDSDGATPIHWAALGGHVHVLRFFAECRVPLDVRATNSLGSQPIHWACCNGHIGAVDILLNNEVSIDTTDNKGCSPLVIAAQFGRTSLAGYLMGRGARTQLVDKEGDNSLHWLHLKDTPNWLDY